MSGRERSRQPRLGQRSGQRSGQPLEQRLQVAQNVWPTLVAAAALFALAVHERLIWPQILGCVLVALVATSLLSVLRPARFDVEVDSPVRVVVGEPFDTVVRVRNLSGVRRGSILVRQRWRSRRSLVGELVGFADGIDGGAEVIVQGRRTPTTRGGADTVDIDVEIAGPFGFFSRVSRHSIRKQLLCLPAPAHAVAIASEGGQWAGVMAGRVADVDVRGVRDWRPGDQISQVHWRSVVRTGRMTVLDRDGRSAGSLVVVVLAPGRQGGRQSKDASFESAVSVAATTATAALRMGTPVCVVAQRKRDSDVAAVQHPGDEASMLECLARIDTAWLPTDDVLEHVLNHAAGGGVIVVVAAKSTPQAWRSRIFDAAGAVGAPAVDIFDLEAPT